MRRAAILTLIAVILALAAVPALAEDVATCFATADRVAAGEAVDKAVKKTGHEACQRALAETSSVVQISISSGASRNRERKNNAADRAEPDPPHSLRQSL